MARKKSEITIDAKLEPSGAYTFEMSGKEVGNNGAKGQKLVFKKTEQEMHKHDDHQVVFKLGKGRDQIRFTRNLMNVLWVQKVDSPNDPCPASPAHLWGEYFAYEVNDDQDELHVVNTNMSPELLAFRLNFVPKGKDDISAGEQYIGYDPITENHNGGLQIGLGGGIG
jgi:hypothetical protein